MWPCRRRGSWSPGTCSGSNVKRSASERGECSRAVNDALAVALNTRSVLNLKCVPDSHVPPTQMCVFTPFQGLNAGVEMFTVGYTATPMYTIALTITKPTLLRKSEKKIRWWSAKRSRRFELLLEYKIL